MMRFDAGKNARTQARTHRASSGVTSVCVSMVSASACARSVGTRTAVHEMSMKLYLLSGFGPI